MRKADLVASIADKTGVAKVDVLVTMEAFFNEVKDTLAKRRKCLHQGFGSYVIKKS